MNPTDMLVRLTLEIEGTCSQGGDYKATCVVIYAPQVPFFLDVVCLKEEVMTIMPAFAEQVAVKIHREVQEFCNTSGGVFGRLELDVTEVEDHGPISIAIYGEEL